MRPFVVVAFLLGAFSVQAVAQSGRAFEMRPFERVDQLRKVRMIDELNLTEDQSVRFFARLNEFDKQRRDRMRAKHEALDRIEQMVKAKADEKEIENALPPVIILEEQMASEKSRFIANLSDILTVTQRAKLLTFERAFENELRQAVRETRKRRMRVDEP